MKNLFNRKICFDEYRNINGIDQYLLHTGTNAENPVMLFLHPSGFPESMLAYRFQEKWEELFTIVHLDQRGIGKTFTKNPKEIPTFDKIIEDIHETVKYLKDRYNKDKIVIFGHSLGTIFGSLYIKRYPEDVLYYIGLSQAVNFRNGEHLAYKKLKELAQNNNDTKTLNSLMKLGEDYPGDMNAKQFSIDGTKFGKLELKYDLVENFMSFPFLIQFIKSPIFKFSDLTAMVRSIKVNEGLLQPTIDFDIRKMSLDYEVPVYYISGENDYQTPCPLVEEYYNEINAPRKKFYILPNARHAAMYTDPNLLYKAIEDIYISENNISLNKKQII